MHDNTIQPHKRVVLRLGESRDVEVCATISMKANADDAMEAFLYPRRKKQPKAWRAMAEHRMRYCLRAPLTYLLCAEVCDCTQEGEEGDPTRSMVRHDKKQHRVVGWAIWYRQAPRKARQKLIEKLGREEFNLPDRYAGLSMSDKTVHAISGSQMYDVADSILNRATSFRNCRALNKSIDDETTHDPSWKEPEDHWYLQEAVVLPTYQRMGIGMQMIGWGIDLAWREGVPILLVSSTAGRRLYDKCGFVEYGSWPWGNEGEIWPLMWWRPPEKMNQQQQKQLIPSTDQEQNVSS